MYYYNDIEPWTDSTVDTKSTHLIFQCSFFIPFIIYNIDSFTGMMGSGGIGIQHIKSTTVSHHQSVSFHCTHSFITICVIVLSLSCHNIHSLQQNTVNLYAYLCTCISLLFKHQAQLKYLHIYISKYVYLHNNRVAG